MPGSDDQYDQVHTYSQTHAGKSKTSRPAVREIGRDGAPVQLYVGEERNETQVRTPPSGVVYTFINQSGNPRVIDSAGTVGSPVDGQAISPSTVSTDSIDIASGGSVAGVLSQAVEHGKILADDGALYDAVQTAENNATDWLFIGPGTFSEAVTIDTTGLTVVGAGRGSTTIDGGTTGTAVTISAPHVTVKSLTVKTTAGGGNTAHGINLGGNNHEALITEVQVESSDADGMNFGNGNDHRIVGNLVRDSAVDGTAIVLGGNTANAIVDGNALEGGAVSDSGASNVVGDNS